MTSVPTAPLTVTTFREDRVPATLTQATDVVDVQLAEAHAPKPTLADAVSDTEPKLKPCTVSAGRNLKICPVSTCKISLRRRLLVRKSSEIRIRSCPV